MPSQTTAPLNRPVPPPTSASSRTTVPKSARVPAADIEGLCELEQEFLGPDGSVRAEAARARLEALAARMRRTLEAGVSRAHYNHHAALQAAIVSAQATLAILSVRPAVPELPRPASGSGQKAPGTAA